MKKAFFVLAILSIASLHSFAEIVSWKGMEMDVPPNPKWLKAWRNKGDERLLRKKFDVEKSSRVVVGFGMADSLEGARAAAHLDAQKKAADSGAVQATRLEYLGEYWEEDDQKGFFVWSAYEQ